MEQLVTLADIRTDAGTQPRAGIDSDRVAQMREAIAADAKLPPIEVFYDGEDYYLVDGFHRFTAYREEGHGKVECVVHQGSLEEAQWASYAANQDHDTAGLRRTNDDKRRAVEAALRHPKAAKMSNRAIAEHVGVSHQTVMRARQVICNNVADTPAIVRTVERAGKTYEMDTTNIGRKAEKEQADDNQATEEISNTNRTWGMMYAEQAVKLLHRISDIDTDADKAFRTVVEYANERLTNLAKGASHE
jgi:transposase